MKRSNNTQTDSEFTSSPRLEQKKRKGEFDGHDEKIDHRYYD